MAVRETSFSLRRVSRVWTPIRLSIPVGCSVGDPSRNDHLIHVTVAGSSSPTVSVGGASVSRMVSIPPAFAV